ncbi:uncharacterized protein LOC129247343 [Anastrepha obliqua]|uniref:uncharacterized protein LOC129247343 n=1 Tax=Anastrepha obliqua TaxID=95512 RepID=UPI00240934EF|nr:uncharacterized protein LOC129247343 [Anastrepha obliqua]
MLRTLLLVAFSTLLIAQFGLCLPKPSSSESAESNNVAQSAQTTTPLPEESNFEIGKKKLETLMHKSYLNLLNYQLEMTNQIAKHVLADPSMDKIDNEAMEYEKSVLRKYVKDSKEALVATLPADKNDQQNRFFFALGKGFVIENFDSFARRRSSKTEELTPEQQDTWDALKKYGFLEYRTNLDNRANEFAGYLADSFDDFMNTLSTAEKEKDKDMAQTWEMYKKNELDLTKIEFGQRLYYSAVIRNFKRNSRGINKYLK